jgi:Tfp pilus assembly protein FimT
VELLVVIGILLLITAMTVAAVSSLNSGDRVRGAGRQVQSYLDGARGRAVYGGNTIGTGYQCGVRFIPDANNPALVTSIQYVELDPKNASITGGRYRLARLDVDNNNIADRPEIVRMIGYADASNLNNSANTKWIARYQQGLITDGQFVVFNYPTSNRRYQLSTKLLQVNIEELILMSPYDDQGTATPVAQVDGLTPQATPNYKILLPPQPMANQEPRSLGNNAVIDLTLSKGLSTLLVSPQRMDIMFSPRGTVAGPLTGTGIVEFVLSDREDSVKGISLPTTTTPNPTTKRDRLIVSLTPQTGMTAVHPVYVDPMGIIADPYRYAETGEVAKQ